MTDERKRKLIRLMNRSERISGKAALYSGQNSRDIYNEKVRQETNRDEIVELRGEALNQELRRQIVYTMLWLLVILVSIGSGIFALVMMFTH